MAEETIAMVSQAINIIKEKATDRNQITASHRAIIQSKETSKATNQATIIEIIEVAIRISSKSHKMVAQMIAHL